MSVFGLTVSAHTPARTGFLQKTFPRENPFYCPARMVFSHGHKEAGLDVVFLKKGKQSRDTLFHTFIGVHMD